MMENEPIEMDRDQIAKANFDLAERLFDEGVHLVYDDDGDTLFLTIGEEQPQVTLEVIEGIYYCVHPESLKIVGFTVLDFAADLLANNKLIRKAFPGVLETFKMNEGVIEWQGLDASKMKPVFELVMSR